MAKNIRMALILCVLMFAFRTYANAESYKITPVRLTVDGESKSYSTYYDTVGGFLLSENFVLNEKDIINLPLDEKLNQTMTTHIKLQRSYFIEISVDGNESFQYEVGPGQKIGHILLELKNATGVEYTYDGFLNEKPEPGSLVNLSTSVVKEFVITVTIPFERETRFTDELKQGEQKVIQEGQYGEITTVTLVDYDAGIEVGRTIKDVIIGKEPVKEIVLLGEKPEIVNTVNIKDGFIYEYELEMEASAYSAKQPGLSNHTKSGDLAVYGVVAVDPEVIPLGTWLYIEGYGKALASDTGSSIIGNKIDLCFNSVEECLQFGRRNIKVYVLK